MSEKYIVKSNKIVTVSQRKTIYDGALVVEDDKIIDIGKFKDIVKKYSNIAIHDFSDYVITPSLIDCHSHLLEYAPSTLYPVTQYTYDLARHSLFLTAIRSGITAFGEQLCGSPFYSENICVYKEKIKEIPCHINLSCNSITIGFKEMSHFTSITGNTMVSKEKLIDKDIITKMAEESSYPGENIFITATPANLTSDLVPMAGNIVYSQDELNEITSIFHSKGKSIGCHVAGRDGIQMAIDAGFDVIHHCHGVSKDQIEMIKKKDIYVVSTPLGGTHLEPNSPENIVYMFEQGVVTAIATDAYLPPYKNVPWLDFNDDSPKGCESLMKISYPSMKLLKERGKDENDILSLITSNSAKVLGKDDIIGSLDIGKEADFIVCSGIPGLDIVSSDKIKKVYYKGRVLIG